MLPEPGMSCSVCDLHLMLSYVEMYERNKMMMMIMFTVFVMHRCYCRLSVSLHQLSLATLVLPFSILCVNCIK